MDIRSAEADIRAIVSGNAARVFLLTHAKRRDPASGKNPLTKQEILHVLEAGMIVEGPSQDLMIKDGWKFTMARMQGDERHVVAAVLVPKTKVVVITGYPDKSAKVVRQPRKPGGIGGDGRDTE